jgi:hypothetical protein
MLKHHLAMQNTVIKFNILRNILKVSALLPVVSPDKTSLELNRILMQNSYNKAKQYPIITLPIITATTIKSIPPIDKLFSQ